MDMLKELARRCRQNPVGTIGLEDIFRLLAAVGMVLQLFRLIIQLRDMDPRDIPWDDILHKED